MPGVEKLFMASFNAGYRALPATRMPPASTRKIDAGWARLTDERAQMEQLQPVTASIQ